MRKNDELTTPKVSTKNTPLDSSKRIGDGFLLEVITPPIPTWKIWGFPPPNWIIFLIFPPSFRVSYIKSKSPWLKFHHLQKYIQILPVQHPGEGNNFQPSLETLKKKRLPKLETKFWSQKLWFVYSCFSYSFLGIFLGSMLIFRGVVLNSIYKPWKSSRPSKKMVPWICWWNKSHP